MRHFFFEFFCAAAQVVSQKLYPVSIWLSAATRTAHPPITHSMPCSARPWAWRLTSLSRWALMTPLGPLDPRARPGTAVPGAACHGDGPTRHTTRATRQAGTNYNRYWNRADWYQNRSLLIASIWLFWAASALCPTRATTNASLITFDFQFPVDCDSKSTWLFFNKEYIIQYFFVISIIID